MAAQNAGATTYKQALSCHAADGKENLRIDEYYDGDPYIRKFQAVIKDQYAIEYYKQNASLQTNQDGFIVLYNLHQFATGNEGGEYTGTIVNSRRVTVTTSPLYHSANIFIEGIPASSFTNCN